METPQLLLLVLLGLLTYTNCLKLPDYIKPCSRNDPNINACAKQHAISAIPHFINGDPKYRVPVLEPLLIEQLSVTQGSSNFGLSFTATNLILSGLKDVQVKDIRIDLKEQHIEYDLFLPILEVRCRYNVSGQVLILPITGSGDGVLVFKDVDLRINFDYDLASKRANGKEYVLPTKFEFTTDLQGMNIHLENLFNGNKFLGDNMNTFLNENWRELVRDLASPIGEALGEVVKIILTNIFELVPYDEAFLDTV
jgi:hypothetical protein